MNFIRQSFLWVNLLKYFFVIKPTRCTNFTILFWPETLHISDSSSVYHQEFILVYVIQVCRQLSSRTRMVPSWSCSKAVWHMPLMSVQWTNSWWWTDELSETCRVSCQNKFVKLVHLVGFITKKFVTIYGYMKVKYM